MLNVSVKDIREKIIFGSWLDIWGKDFLVTDFGKYVVKKIDNSEVFDRNVVISPILGGIPPADISNGAKVLICINFTDNIFCISHMGENCYEVLAEICRRKDVTLIADISILPFRLGDFDRIHFLDDDSYVETDRDFIRKYISLGGV